VAQLAPAYLPRRPTETVLYGIVREHLASFLAYTRERYERPLPAYVEAELRSYLRCGFNLHADVRIEAGDDVGRERLCRYAARPPVALDRLRRLPGGRVAYRLKYTCSP